MTVKIIKMLDISDGDKYAFESALKVGDQIKDNKYLGTLRRDKVCQPTSNAFSEHIRQPIIKLQCQLYSV